MIAARFRLVGWVAGCAGAALVCYMASQSVAAERSALTKVDSQIADTKADIARLDTEITARSRAGQVEHWNGVLALQAARPVQYVQSGFQLASLAGGRHLPLDPQVTGQAAVQAASLQVPAKPAAAPVAPEGSPEVPTPTLRTATLVRAKALPLDPGTPGLIKASYVKEAPIRPIEAPALIDPTPAKVEKSKADRSKTVVAKADKSKPPIKLADADLSKAKPKKAKAEDGLLPDDLGKLIAAERHAKPHKAL
jgi:hypothetical protein